MLGPAFEDVGEDAEAVADMCQERREGEEEEEGRREGSGAKGEELANECSRCLGEDVRRPGGRAAVPSVGEEGD